VYSEAEYLAGADASGEWHTSPPARAPHEHRLRRLGAAGVLTGALGALGGVVVFAGIGVRSPHRLLAVTGAPVKGGVVLREGEADGAPSRGDRVRRSARTRHTRRGGLRGVHPSARRRPALSARATVAMRSLAARPVGATPAVAYDATRSDPGDHAATAPTRSEFGFER
jgi:hypothetical protein